MKRFARLRAVVCAFKGHSAIVTTCFGYIHCGRCGAMLGDTLAGAYDVSDKVVVGHNCEKCRANYLKLTFWDKFLVEDPFVKGN